MIQILRLLLKMLKTIMPTAWLAVSIFDLAAFLKTLLVKRLFPEEIDCIEKIQKTDCNSGFQLEATVGDEMPQGQEEKPAADV